MLIGVPLKHYRVIWRVNTWGAMRQQVVYGMFIKVIVHLLLSFMGCNGWWRVLLKNVWPPTPNPRVIEAIQSFNTLVQTTALTFCEGRLRPFRFYTAIDFFTDHFLDWTMFNSLEENNSISRLFSCFSLSRRSLTLVKWLSLARSVKNCHLLITNDFKRRFSLKAYRIIAS